MSVNRKIFGLASSLALFAGMAYGQNALVCGTTSGTIITGAPTISPTNPIELRAEGVTELVSDTITPCAAATTTIQGNVTAYITGSGVQGITSKSIGSGLTEATLQIIDPTGSHSTVYYSGAVSGSAVTFGTTLAPVNFPMYAFDIQISNVRVNVSGTYPSVPQAVTETVFAGAQGVAALFTVAPQTVGYIRDGLQVNGTSTPVYTGAGGGSTIGSAGIVTNFPVCTAQSASSAFTVTVTELFAGAFKTGTVTAANQGGALLTPASANIPGSESGSLFAGSLYGADKNAAGTEEGSNFPTSSTTPVGTSTSGTRIKFVFANIPTNVTLSVPLTLTSPNGGAILTMQLTNGTETGAFSAATSGTLTASGGAATAIYEVTTANLTVIKSATLTAFVTYSANSVVAPAGPISVTTSFSPSPATPGAALPATIPTIPYFANTGTTLNASSFNVCQTTLLFPFITNQQGFETGIAIANTGLDNLNPTGKVTSVATGQSGACMINFYGSVAAEGGAQPTQATAANFPASTSKTITAIAPGQTHADTLTDVIGGPFQGYAIAVCPFLYARGFAFIESGLSTSNGIVEGYLADVIAANRGSALTYVAGTVNSNSMETSGH